MEKSSLRKRKSKKPPSPSLGTTSTGDGVPPDRLFPIVAIGASAGGLEAFSTLLANLPQKSGMAFVFLQHLDPKHHSALQEILSRSTQMPVAEVTDGVRVERDHLYIIPPNTDMAIKDGVLRLTSRTLTHGQHRPIDAFFSSLAEDCGDRAIGVILSGSSSDGTSGCLAIKAVGGITLAQDEASAKYSSMPKTAVDSGCIDFVLPPTELARELVRISKHPYIVRLPTRPDELLGPALPSDIHQLFSLLRTSKGVDFTHYKQTTLQRRIKRRMVVNQIERLEDYLPFVKQHPKELDALYRDILINVTGFFRDPGAFDSLRKDIFPELVKNRKASEWPIRVWIPGCSSGEEVYSLAIALLEYVGINNANISATATYRAIQIFGTDVSEDALERARAGVYSEAALGDLSPARAKRFFHRVDRGYQVLPAVRELCIFARQDIAKDPPFSSLDLISCRNLLIYLGPELQKRVIPTLHYALKPGGFLMLGAAESLGVFADYFILVDKKYKIYKKKTTGARLVTFFTGVDYALRGRDPEKAPRHTPERLNIEKEVERELVNRFVPASIVINSDMEIVQFRGKTGAYLEPAAGNPTFSLSKMAREGLLVDLRAAINTAKRENVPVRREGVSIQSNGGTRDVNFEVIPVQGQESSQRFYIIVFQDAIPEKPPRAARNSRKKNAETPVLRQNERLQRELRLLRQQLQSLIEEHESTTEEFKTANEEVLSSNEELQSTNEELETAKEELQSTNEELTTVNEELQNRNFELATSNNDLRNVLNDVNIPIVIVNNDVRVRMFTPAAQKLLNLLPGDVGRYLREIRPNIDTDNLEQFARQVIETNLPQDLEVRDASGAWLLMRGRPYRTTANKVEGALITFQDVDTLKRQVEETRAYASTMIETAREPLLVLDPQLCVVVANPSFYSTFRVTSEETVGRSIFELGNGQWDIPALRQLLTTIISGQGRVDDFEVRHNFEHIGDRTMLLNARRLQPSPDRSLIFLSIVDVSALKQSEENLRRLSSYLMSVQDEERRRFARELHDSTGQKLAVAKLNLDTVIKSPQHKDSHKLVAEASQWLDEAFKEIRTVSHLLHPPLLDEAGLVSATRWLAEGFSQRSKIRTDLQVQGTISRLDQAIELALFRVIQEALSNVHRHSGAKHAEILLAQSPDGVILEVRDDGKGIPNEVLTGKSLASQNRLGVGVLGMRERLSQLGGSLEIVTGKQGTTIRALVPNSSAKSNPATAS